VVATFTWAELRAYAHGCHPTLSRELRHWTRADRHRWSPLVFVAAASWLAWHVSTLKDLPIDKTGPR
jgi:hypothetical protein